MGAAWPFGTDASINIQQSTRQGVYTARCLGKDSTAGEDVSIVVYRMTAKPAASACTWLLMTH